MIVREQKQKQNQNNQIEKKRKFKKIFVIYWLILSFLRNQVIDRVSPQGLRKPLQVRQKMDAS